MKKLFPILFLFLGDLSLRAADAPLPVTPPSDPSPIFELKSGKISHFSGNVKISGAQESAKTGDILPEKVTIDTGTASICELLFEDGSVMRLSEKTTVLFLSKERIVQLQRGTILFYSPMGHGGITLQDSRAKGQVSGSTVMAVRDPDENFSFLVLESSGAGSVSGPSVPLTFLGAGQMTTVRAAGGEPPQVMDVHVDAIRDISPLFQAIPTDLPSDTKVVGTTEQQAFEIQTDVKLLSSLDNFKLTATDPEGVALAMICKVGSAEMGAAKNILLRPMDTAAGNQTDPDTAAGGGGTSDTQAPIPPVLSPIQPAQTTPI